jgi:hypothetical protein
MKRLTIGVTAAAFVLGLSALRAEEKTITGEVIDAQCQMKDASKKGEAHAACAMKCAQKGAPLALLAKDGVYMITGDYTKENNKQLVAFVAKNVVAKGEATEKDGKLMLDVKSIEAAK